MGGYSNLLFLLMDNLIIVVEHLLLFLFADMFLYRRLRGFAPMIPALAVSWLLQYWMAALEIGPAKILLSLAMDAACLLLYYTGNRHLGKLLKKAFLLASYYAFMSVTQAASIAALYSLFGGGQVLDLHAEPVLA